MEKSVGRALESALKEKGGTKGDEVESSKRLFSNRHRREVFSTLTLCPCIGASILSRKTSIKVNTVSWHLSRLVETGYVVERRKGKSRIFFPEGLVNDDEVDLFHTLNLVRVKELMHTVINSPGSSQMELAGLTGLSHQHVSRTMRKLENLRLTSNVTEGSHIRYYPTMLIAEGAEGFYNRSKGFANIILKKLKVSEGGEPSVVKKGGERLFVEMGSKKSPYTMEIGVNPFITIFEC